MRSYVDRIFRHFQAHWWLIRDLATQATLIRIPNRPRLAVDWYPERGPRKLKYQIPELRHDLRDLLNLFAAMVAAMLWLWMAALLFTVSLFAGALLFL